MFSLEDLKKTPPDFFDTNITEHLDEDAIKYHLNSFLEVLIEFVNAGYHEEKNLQKIPDWCVTFTEPIMEYFIEYFEIKTEADDIFLVDQFLTTPEFRKMITVLMAKVVSKYKFENLTPKNGMFDIIYLEDAKLNLGV